MEYQKINTVFMRDMNNIIIPTMYSKPEFKYLENALFEATEKIDGTNVRVEIDYFASDVWTIEYKGRTDAADLPGHLLDKLKSYFDDIDLPSIFKYKKTCHITLFGEGYGQKIQKYGDRYISDGCDFILFDVRIDSWWLSRANCEDIARKLGVKIVPFVGTFTIPQAIEYVKAGFKSSIAEDNTLDAEGLVLKTPDGLLYRNGERIVLKIKTKDFVQYARKYPNGCDNQVPNPKYKEE